MILGKNYRYMFVRKNEIAYMLAEIKPKQAMPYTYINLYKLNPETWQWAFLKQIEVKRPQRLRDHERTPLEIHIVGWALYRNEDLPVSIGKERYEKYIKEFLAHLKSGKIDDMMAFSQAQIGRHLYGKRKINSPQKGKSGIRRRRANP